MDVKTAFLNGSFEEEIYMDQPVDFASKGQEDKSCHLKRSLYGLKQSSGSWCLRFHEAITSFDLSVVSEHHCVYVKRSMGGIMFITLYFDNILLAGNNLEMIEATKKRLSSVFEIKDKGEARYVLSVEIIRNHPKKLLGMSQEAYIKKVLEQFCIHYSKPVDTLVEGFSLESRPMPKNRQRKGGNEQCPLR